MNKLYQSKGIQPLITTNTDYVLLQSGRTQLNHTTFSNGAVKPAKHFMLDAGTSSFETSLYWFTCAYLQVSVLYIDLVFNVFFLYVFILEGSCFRQALWLGNADTGAQQVLVQGASFDETTLQLLQRPRPSE